MRKIFALTKVIFIDFSLHCQIHIWTIPFNYKFYYWILLMGSRICNVYSCISQMEVTNSKGIFRVLGNPHVGNVYSWVSSGGNTTPDRD